MRLNIIVASYEAMQLPTSAVFISLYAVTVGRSGGTVGRVMVEAGVPHQQVVKGDVVSSREILAGIAGIHRICIEVTA